MKVLIIEDDDEIVEVISLSFQIRWPEVELVSTNLGREGVEMVEKEKPDIVILDLGLPDSSGFDVLKEIRTFSLVPVIILTVRGDESDVVKGLEWGADDYMVKPFRQLELLSRIKALTRRSGRPNDSKQIVHGELTYDPATRQLFSGKKEIEVTRAESYVLYHLMKNAGRVVTYSDLARAVWGEDYPDAANALKVYILRLRQKLEEDPGQPKLILTKSGVGYQMAKPDLPD